MDDLFRDVHQILDRQTGIPRNIGVNGDALLPQLRGLHDLLSSIDQRLRNPLAALLPLDIQLRANHNQIDGTVGMTIAFTQPQLQTQQTNGQVLNATSSTSHQGRAVNGANRPTNPRDNVSKPTAFGAGQPSKQSKAAQKQKEEARRRSGGTAQNQNQSTESAESLFSGSNNQPETEAERARRLQDERNDRQGWNKTIVATSPVAEDAIYDDADDEQSQPKTTAECAKPGPLNQNSQSGRKGTAGNDQPSLHSGEDKDAKSEASSKATTDEGKDAQRNETTASEASSTDKRSLRDRNAEKKDPPKLANLVPRKDSKGGKAQPTWGMAPANESRPVWSPPDPEPARRGSRLNPNKPTTKDGDQAKSKDSKEPEKTAQETTEIGGTVAPAPDGSVDNSVHPPNTGNGSKSKAIRGTEEPDVEVSSDNESDGINNIPPNGPPVRRKKRRASEEGKTGIFPAPEHNSTDIYTDEKEDPQSPPKKQKQGKSKGKDTESKQ